MGTATDRESQINALFVGLRAERLAGVVCFDAAQHAASATRPACCPNCRTTPD